MKKFLLSLLMIVAVIGLTGCGNNEDEKVVKTDAIKFKEEYESINGEELYGKKARELTIPEKNPFVYATADEIVEMMDNEETFAVYFGFNTCPWCRAAVSTLIDVANDLNIKKVYYVDVKEIRNVLEVVDGEVITKKEGSKGYMKLLKKLDNVLDDYELTDEDDKEVDAHMKRIYAPNVVSIVDGKAEKMTTATSDDLENPYDELTDKIIADSYDMIECTLECISNKNNVCDRNC